MNKNVKHQILLAIFSLAMLFSCQKNKDTEVVTKQQFQMTESAQIIYNKLVAFKKAIDNPQKSTTTMQLDSAEWYVEAFYNVTQGYPDSLFGKFEVDTMYYTLPLDENQMARVTDLGLLLDNMESHLNSLLAQSGTELAHMVIGDVVVDFSERSFEAQVTVYTGLGFGPGPLYTPFVDEYWYWGYTLGRCDPVNPPPPPPYHDAGDELEWRFNSPNPWYVPYPACANGKIKITGASHTWKNGYEDDRIFYELRQGAYDPPCLDPETLNTLLGFGAELFYQKEANNGLIPDGNNFFTSVGIYTFADSISGYGWRYYHGYAAYYSTFECLPGGILD